ncbi:hypothetical protein ACFRAQ_29185 [Nocardia sp. NPDC056611]|uniref:hypothetical protein n=1 Tax=Nocardia sp. NPDC056611 TaxID=3345877 RepID=UPI0036728FC1
MTFDPTGKTADQILDHGAPGLCYWEQFLPLYAKAFGEPAGVNLTELYARYDEQRGLNLDEFDTARSELDKALADAESRFTSHHSVANSLPAAWTGPTGTEALALLNSQLRQARDDLDTLRTASTAIVAALDPIRDAILTKAERTRGLLEPTPDGEAHITIEGRTPDAIGALGTADPWLTATFRPEVDRQLAAFTATCAATADTVESHYRTIITAFEQVIDHTYPQPSQTLLPQPETNSAALLGSRVGAQPDSTGVQTNPAGAQPSVAPAPSEPDSSPPTVGPGQCPQADLGAARSRDCCGPGDSGAPGPAQEGPGRPVVGTATGQPCDHACAKAVPTRPVEATEPASVGPAAGVEPPVSNTPTPADSGSVAVPKQAQPQAEVFAQALAGLIGKLETGLQQGLSAVLEQLGSLSDPASDTPGDGETPAGRENSAYPDKPADPNAHADSDKPTGADRPAEPPPGPGTSNLPSGHLEFDLAGKHFVVDREPTGDMSISATDESGRTQVWSLTTDDSGTPALAPDNAAGHPSVPAAGDPDPATAAPDPRPPGNSPPIEAATPTGPPCAAEVPTGFTPVQVPCVAPPSAESPTPAAPSGGHEPPTCTGTPELDVEKSPDGGGLSGCDGLGGVKLGGSTVCPAVPETPGPTAPLGGESPRDGGVSLDDPSVPVSPADPGVVLGSPDVPLEIPEAGVEIP